MISDSSAPSAATSQGERRPDYRSYIAVLIIILFAAAIYIGCIISPPSLMDDVDAVQAQIARNMLTSGDWVTARLDGVLYLEKAPLIYWLMAICFKVFGAYDWVARIPVAVACVGLAWVTTSFGIWAFGRRAGLYAGLCVSTCIGLFLFTRILIPDVMLTATVALAMWSFLRALDEEERRPRLWAFLFAASIGLGLLWKSLIGAVFPIGAGLTYLFFSGQLLSARTWRKLQPLQGVLIILLIAAPWHVLATLRNPPYFEFTMRSAPGEYHGFLWFYFINEQLLRFLNMRYPRDYDTVPRVLFWSFHLLWFFPWSFYIPSLFGLSYKPLDRAGRTRLLALCWVGFVMIFFTFSTTQEYYSMPCYPALALLIGSGMAAGGVWIRRGTLAISAVSSLAAIAVITLLFLVHGVPTPGDISGALTENPAAYKLSLGHMEDLTIESFAYLRLPLAVAAVAFIVGCLGTFRGASHRAYPRAYFSAAVMMVIFFHAARLAMVVFDPYLSSRPLARALMKGPQGELIVDHHYYDFSSVFFYTNRSALLLNGRFNNLVYGSYAPGAPPVFIDDRDFQRRWPESRRYYLVAEKKGVERIEKLIARNQLFVAAYSGGKYLLTNHPTGGSSVLNSDRKRNGTD